MSEHHDSHEHHGATLGHYAGVFIILLIGTGLTYWTALMDLDHYFTGANTLLALVIAFFKMSCVVWIFMHVKWNTRLIWLTVGSSFFWLAIMFAYTMQDYLTRVPGNQSWQ